jgi:outer membrane protein assembly factor BamB
MVFSTRRQRAGRAPLMSLLLMGAFLALAGYEYWVNSDRQEQDDSEIGDLERANLKTPGGPLSAPDHGPASKDWPQWRGPHRDAVAPGDGLLTDWPESGPPVLWTADGGEGFSSLAIADGRLFTLVQDGDDEVVLCLDAEKGRRLWRFPYPSRFTRDGVGPRATPTVAGKHVYTLGARGHLYCLEVATGKEVWHRDLCTYLGAPLPTWGFSCSPLVDDNLLLLHTGAPGASIVALDRGTGYVQWKILDDPAGYSSPVAGTLAGVPQVVFLTGTALVGLEPRKGRVLWRFPFETPHEANAATPLVRGDYVFVSAGYNQGCALVRVVKKDDGSLEARRVYKNNLMRNHFSTSVFHGDHIYGFDEGYLTCLPFRKGKPRAWKERKFHRGTLLVVGDRLIVLGENGNLALVEPTPEEYREKALCKVADGRCWTVPALAQGRLYVRDDAHILCLDLRKR